MNQKRILLHICCAPCAIYPLKVLRERGFEVEGIFFNPNIHPQGEFIERQQAVAQLASKENLTVYYPQHRPSLFFEKVKKTLDNRCGICWKLRLSEVAKFAIKNNFSHFTSTLLVSPYQNIETINELGKDAARNFGLEFYFKDFRSGFHTAHNAAKSLGLYRQKYCGCLYSLEEQNKNKSKAKCR